MALYRVAKFAEALPLAQQVLAIAEKALGPDHPVVATSLNDRLRSTIAKVTTPTPSRPPSAGWRSGNCSVGYPDVALSLSELASLYDRQGRYADAALTVAKHRKRVRFLARFVDRTGGAADCGVISTP
jgi:hypothetical protein